MKGRNCLDISIITINFKLIINFFIFEINITSLFLAAKGKGVKHPLTLREFVHEHSRSCQR